ncbi:lipopolysaccharide assembly protein LapB [Ferrimonas sediminicola]|uniref:Lipopolysaccharide assembly protein B n=1 Tax=Ferrimonas sediminicola TaxID=2569538 RepID=A0A4V5NVG6_9GAMM|nr:lipopolysaccharide assembly protein LapB [Ferrimonas sediminicola]TKB50393.1 lipopolysaccharide assembly protein LapB [Ferrimonas sediminicola]
MLELFFLLLPVAAAYGWYMGQRSAGNSERRRARAFSKNYYEGLNFLLSDQPDKAVDLFIELLQVDEETFETHLSLGNLFRKRGEVDRSIRIHQNLIARPHLTTEQRDAAMMELGKDYLAAGLYDRAEDLFLKLVKEPDHSEDAERQLLSIYQATKEWWKAIKVARKFGRVSRKELKPIVAHYYCELAQQEQDPAGRMKLLDRALSTDGHCVRAMVEKIRALQGRDNAGAAKLVTKLVAVAPDMLPEVVDDAEAIYRQLGLEDQFVSLLHTVLERDGNVSTLLKLVDITAQTTGTEQAELLLLEHLKRQPTMRGFHHLMQLQMAQADLGAGRERIAMLSKLVEAQIKLRPIYRCRRCGFPSHSLYWHCPSCKSWGEGKRIRGLDGE